MWQQVDGWLRSADVGRVATVLVVLALVLIGARALRSYFAARIEDTDARYRARKLVTIGGYAVALLVLVIGFGSRLAGLGIALGVAGAGVTFGLKDVIASVAGWVAVALGGMFKPGDRIELGGVRGDVVDIAFLRTTLMECGQWVDGDLYNGRIVRVSNAAVFASPVVNYSGEFAFLWDEIRIPVRYGSDVQRARRILAQAAETVVGDYARGAEEEWRQLVRRYRLEEASVLPLVTLVANDNWLELTLRYIVDYRKRRSTKDALFSRIYADIQQSEGAVSLASATFEVVGAPPLDVRVGGPKG